MYLLFGRKIQKLTGQPVSFLLKLKVARGYHKAASPLGATSSTLAKSEFMLGL
jgi:hypothetical protein